MLSSFCTGRWWQEFNEKLQNNKSFAKDIADAIIALVEGMKNGTITMEAIPGTDESAS